MIRSQQYLALYTLLSVLMCFRVCATLKPETPLNLKPYTPVCLGYRMNPMLWLSCPHVGGERHQYTDSLEMYMYV